jgi:hypothetical protein
LKSTRKNLVTIGAGLSNLEVSYASATFKTRICVNMKLPPNKHKSQLAELCDYWKNQVKEESSNILIDDICEFLCDYCGGHFFSTAMFSEHAFTHPDAKISYGNLINFKQYFHSENFQKSETMMIVRERCFNPMLSPIKTALGQVFLGQATDSDVSRLEELGFISSETKDIVSPMLCNEFLATISFFLSFFFSFFFNFALLFSCEHKPIEFLFV